MDISNKICQLFGEEVKKYFERKLIGGASNQKGARYENFFAVFQLIQSFYILLENTREGIEICSQVEAFVDDLLICDISNNSYRYFQLKNVNSINWGSGLKSIADDFCKQKKLNEFLGIQLTQTTLVCSNQNLSKKLTNEMPINIKGFSQVIFFPYAETINHLLLSNQQFKETIELICFSNETSKLEALAKIILGIWEDKKTTISSVQRLLNELKNEHPNFLADGSDANKLLPEVENILQCVPNFSFVVDKGYFKWEYQKGLDSGEFFTPVNSEEFLNFQRSVIGLHPKEFSELEGILL